MWRTMCLVPANVRFSERNLNFNLDKLKPKETWDEKLEEIAWNILKDDSQLRDILITGGDALMSSDKSLEKIWMLFMKWL